MQPLTDALHKEPTLISSTHYCVVGDVTVDESSAIAPGVVIQASSGSRIVIGKGVCIAAGVCIQSRSGVLTISSGVSLGANVLIVGHGTIGTNACISPGSTLINPAVAAEAILPPASLIGADSTASSSGHNSDQNNSKRSSFKSNSFKRKGIKSNGFKNDSPATLNDSSNGYTYSQPLSRGPSSTTQPETFKNTFIEPGPISAKPVSIPDLSDQSSEFVPPPSINQPFNQPYNQTNGVQSGQGSSSLTVHSSNEVYGKSQVNQLIAALFPNRQSLNGNSSS